MNAFTTVPFGGNPAAVVIEAEGLTEEEMQRIAREMNLSETTFVASSERADFRVRFFTPVREIDLAGHPTITTFHALVEEGLIAARDGVVTVTQELNVGVLPRDEWRALLLVQSMSSRSPKGMKWPQPNLY